MRPIDCLYSDECWGGGWSGGGFGGDPNPGGITHVPTGGPGGMGGGPQMGAGTPTPTPSVPIGPVSQAVVNQLTSPPLVNPQTKLIVGGVIGVALLIALTKK